jgi:hypothetical protein
MKSLNNSDPLSTNIRKLPLLAVDSNSEELLNRAECRKPEHNRVNFFPGFPMIKGQWGVIETERRIASLPLSVCAKCAVVDLCKKEHEHEQFGVFYNTTPAERKVSLQSLRRVDWRNCPCLACAAKRIHIRGAKSD